MDQELIVKSAVNLDQVLRKYAAVDQEAKAMLIMLYPLIQDACSGKVVNPLEWRNVPGIRDFEDGNLRQYLDLDDAHAKFLIEVTGGITPARRNILDGIREKRIANKQG